MSASEFELNAAIADWANRLVAQRHVPRATYRVQTNHTFGFKEIADIVPYLQELGVSDCYSAPILRAAPGTMHGYDVCDHTQLNPELGTSEDFDALAEALRARGMGLLLDMVPNHMGIATACNQWWMDVLENGPASLYARYFDIDWHPVNPALANKVLLPILEDQYGTVLESGKLVLQYEDGSFYISYYDRRLPLAPDSLSRILNGALELLVNGQGEHDDQVAELQSILTALSYLPGQAEEDPERIVERNREKEIVKRRIAALAGSSPELAAALQDTVNTFNGHVGDPRSFDQLDALLDEQAYRPAYWRIAAEEINFRRFFDINELAAIRVEDPQVFEQTHNLVLDLLTRGKITGLRIDHPDGLWNPPGYFRQLQTSYLMRKLLAESGDEASTGVTSDGPTAQEGVATHLTVEEMEHAITSWVGTNAMLAQISTTAWPLFVVVEKILAADEPLPLDWAVDGTTGYDFLASANGLFVASANQGAFDSLYRRFTGMSSDFPTMVSSAKKMTMLVSLASEVNTLATQLHRIAERNRRYRDFTLNSLTFAIREVIASLSVYRTYLTGAEATVSDRDKAYVESAVAEAKRHNPRTAGAVFDFIGDTLLMRTAGDFGEEDHSRIADFVMKFQQVTGPVMAKSVEDTVFYTFSRLISLNEVGGDPEIFGTSSTTFHEENAERGRRWPHSLLATATHDTKRGEDTRARISALSEMPDEWEQAVIRWADWNAVHKTLVGGRPAPDRNDEYLLYQTLLGCWPTDPDEQAYAELTDRIAAYMQKAIKEAKVHSSWVNPNEAYDAATERFVRAILDRSGAGAFLDDLVRLGRRVAHFGRINSLAQTLLKLTAPGVPDVYQGTELWDLSLVDPDNRRPVDYGLRRAALTKLREEIGAAGGNLGGLARRLVEHPEDGLVKLYLIHRTLSFRAEQAELFRTGSYEPLTVTGQKAAHICAFARVHEGRMAIVVVPRLVAGLTDGATRLPLGPDVWGDTQLEGIAAGTYVDQLTGYALSVGSEPGSGALAVGDVLRGHAGGIARGLRAVDIPD